MIDLRLILVSPKTSGNVGSVARVVANFDVTDFRVVAPRCDILDKQAKLFATGPSAEDLDNAKICQDLSAAIEGATAVVAFTRRVGNLSPEPVSFQALPHWVSEQAKHGGKVALVFGREDFCLLHDEVLLCTHLVTIPASQRMPTMNLSHSVAAVLSAIYSNLGHVPLALPPEGQPATVENFEELIVHWHQTMRDAGMESMHNLDITMKRMRRVLQRATPNRDEVAMLRGFLARLQNALGTRQRVRGNSTALTTPIVTAKMGAALPISDAVDLK